MYTFIIVGLLISNVGCRNDSSELPSAVVVSVSVLAINTSKGVSYDSNYRSSSLSNPVEINYVNIGVCVPVKPLLSMT